MFGPFDLGRRVGLEIGGVGVVDHPLAETDELAAQEKIEDGAPVIGGVDDGHRRRRQTGEVLGAADILELGVLVENALERHRVGDLAPFDQLGAGIEDAPVDGIGEMLGLEKLRDPVVGEIVDKDGAEQCLLGVEIVRRGPVALVFGFGKRGGRGTGIRGYHEDKLPTQI